MKNNKKNVKKRLSVLMCGMLATTAFGLVGCNNKDLSSGKIYKGTDYSIATNAKDGDFFIDTDDFKLYQKIDGSWELIKENYGNNKKASIVDYNIVGYKSIYLLNEEFNTNDTKLRLIMSDNTYKDISVSINMISAYPDMTVAGIKTLVIRYDGNEYTYEIEVKDNYSPTTSYAISVLNSAKNNFISSSKFMVKSTSNGVTEDYILDSNQLFIRKSNGVNTLQSEWLIEDNGNIEKYIIDDAKYSYSCNDSSLSTSTFQEFVDLNTSSILTEDIEESKISSVEYLNGVLTIVYEKSSTETVEYVIKDENIVGIVKNDISYSFSYNENSSDIPEKPVSSWSLSDSEAKEQLQKAIAKSTSQNKIGYTSTWTNITTKEDEELHNYRSVSSVICDNIQNIAYLNNITSNKVSWNFLQNEQTSSVMQYAIEDGIYYKRETHPLGNSESFAQLYMPDPLKFNDWSLSSYSGTFTNNETNSFSISFSYNFDKDLVNNWDSSIVTYSIENGLITKFEQVKYKDEYSKNATDDEFSHKIHNDVSITEIQYNDSANEIPDLNTNLFPDLTASEYLSQTLSNVKIASKIKAELFDNDEIVGKIIMDADNNVVYSTSNNLNIAEKWVIKDENTWISYWIDKSNSLASYKKYSDSVNEEISVYDKFLSLEICKLNLNDKYLGESSACYKNDGKIYLETTDGWTLTIENGWIVSATDKIQTIKFTYGSNNVTESIPSLPDYNWQ